MDSVPKIVVTMQRAAQALSVSEPTDMAVKEIIGLGLPEAIAQLFPDLEQTAWSALREAYSRIYLEERALPPLFPGAKELLAEIAAQGRQLAVVTGKSRKGLDRALSHCDVGSLFVASRCADETLSKPEPAMVLEVLEELKVQPEQAVVVGDTEYDMEMGVRAGVDCVGATYGAHHGDRLVKYNPLACIDDIGDLLLHLD